MYLSSGLDLGSAVTAAFLTSLVEAVEALTIILAAAIVRGWRLAFCGESARMIALGDAHAVH